jgi:hypothetical protein
MGGKMNTKRLGLLFTSLVALASCPALAAAPVPQVTGPIAATDIPGTPTHNYPFFASNHDLASHGYVEQEYFIRGTADSYTVTDKLKDATANGSPQAYYTRVVVRRPADAKHFNGTAVVEWDNVTNNFDAENVWFDDWEDMMRSGYVWVGVTNQTLGVDALKKFSAKRYGEFDVGKAVAGSVPRGTDADAESYDIFTQIGAALKHPAGVDMLGGLKPKILLATGQSQSAGRLTTYVNSVQPLAKVYDGFLLDSSSTPVRSDTMVPVLKVMMEHDVLTGGAATRQPDTDKFREWEIAGTSHMSRHVRESREPLELRDNGLSLEAKMAPLCANPQIGTRTPAGEVIAAGFAALSRWSEGGKPPAIAPKLDVTQINASPKQSVVARNQDGLAMGGIQLASQVVPTQFNIGLGAPADPAEAKAGGEAIGAGACVRWGPSTDMTVDQLNAHYPSHADYVAKVKKVVAQNVKDGFLLPVDGAAMIKTAEDSRVGRDLVKAASN